MQQYRIFDTIMIAKLVIEAHQSYPKMIKYYTFTYSIVEKDMPKKTDLRSLKLVVSTALYNKAMVILKILKIKFTLLS